MTDSMPDRPTTVFVHGGDELARRRFEEDGRAYWTQAFPLVLEKHGYLDAGEVSAADFELAAWDSAAVVLVGELPPAAWTHDLLQLVGRAIEGKVSMLIEGPLPPLLDEVLGVRPSPAPRRPGAVTVSDPELLEAARRFGVPPGGPLTESRSRPVERRAELDWAGLGLPISEEQAAAWAAPGWGMTRWSASDRAAVLAEWSPAGGGAERHPAIVRNRSLVGCAFGLFSFLGQRHTSEPFSGAEHRMSDRSSGLEAMTLGLIDLMHAWQGRTRARVMPWPNGARWVRSVRHDYDRPLSRRRLGKVLRRHREADTAATWYWKAAHLSALGAHRRTSSPRAEVVWRLRAIRGSARARDVQRAGHEVALHAERLWAGGDRELEQLESALEARVLGASAHGDPGSFRFQGAPNVLWAEAKGLLYTELIQQSHLHPHRFAALGADGTIAPLSVVCLPHHESFDASTRPGDTNAQQVAQGLARWIDGWGFLQLMNHPDQNIDELFDLLGRMPGEDRLDWTAREVADWWSRTHVAGEIALVPLPGGRFKVRSRRASDGVTIEMLEPSGATSRHQVDLDADWPVVVGPDAVDGGRPRADRWDAMAGVFARVVREYHTERGQPIDAAVERSIRGNSSLVPERAEELTAALRALSGAELRGRRVLHVGCGFGALAAYLAVRERPASLTGLDIRPDFLTAASRASLQLGLAGFLDLVHGDMRDLSAFEPESMDVVLCINSFIFLPTAEDAARTVEEFRRVLVPGGHLFFYHANRWRLRDPFTADPLVHVLPRPLASAVRPVTGWRHSRDRARLLSQAELGRLLRRHGFERPRAVGLLHGKHLASPARHVANYYALAARRAA